VSGFGGLLVLCALSRVLLWTVVARTILRRCAPRVQEYAFAGLLLASDTASTSAAPSRGCEFVGVPWVLGGRLVRAHAGSKPLIVEACGFCVIGAAVCALDDAYSVLACYFHRMNRLITSVLFLSACNSGATLVELDPEGTDVDVADADSAVEADTEDVVDCTPVDAVEGGWLEDTLSGSLEWCDGALHAFGGRRDAVIDLVVDEWTGEAVADVIVTTVGGEELHRESVGTGGIVTVVLPWSGEFLVSLRSTDDGPADWTMSQECRSGCEGLWTRYPVVLMHGMAGTDQFIGVLDYFYGIEDDLTPRGVELVIGTVDPFQSTAVRAVDWAVMLDETAAEGHHRGFNLVGHSQGGLDARYVASQLDPLGRIRSITTIGTPHRGTAVSDASAGVLEDARITAFVIDAMFDGLALFYGLNSDQDIVAQMSQFSTASMAQFNLDNTDREDVVYASWAGVTCGAFQFGCQRNNAGEVVSPLFSTSRILVSWFEGESDGLVSVDSAAWGTVRGTIPADHTDEVGQVGGLTAPRWDHVAFYRDEMRWLAAQGL
jgi:triacylglycerol lipase